MHLRWVKHELQKLCLAFAHDSSVVLVPDLDCRFTISKTAASRGFVPCVTCHTMHLPSLLVLAIRLSSPGWNLRLHWVSA